MYFVQRTKAVTAVSETLAEPAVTKCFDDIGQELLGQETLGQKILPQAQQNPAELAARQKAEIERWWPVIKEAGIKSE